jgi:hypothetical protein
VTIEQTSQSTYNRAWQETEGMTYTITLTLQRGMKMKYAQEISGMINAFNDSELTGKDLDTFSSTMRPR